MNKLLLSAMLFVLIMSVKHLSAQTYIISTLAGNETAGYSGNGGAATAAELSNPVGIAIDTSGNVYITDAGNHRIRKVSTSGIISTIAGNGTAGYSGDGGAATLAELSAPIGIVVDSSGNIYFADDGNNTVRKINTSGIISTIAGTGTWGYSGDGAAATSAELAYPEGVAIDASGNIYVDDDENNRIRIVNTSGTISTIAGNGTNGYSGDGGAATSAELNYPYGVAVDGPGNVYIADEFNNRIRKVNTNGIISTIAGNGTAGYSGDGGAATSAELNHIIGVAVDDSGNVYIADATNHRVRKVNMGNNINTIAGTGTAGYSGDGGKATTAELDNPDALIMDAYGSVYVSDDVNNDVRKLTPECLLAPPLSIQPSSPSICSGEGITLSVSSSGSGYTWSPSSTINSSTGDNVVAIPSVTTTYTVTGTDSLGCLMSAKNVVTVIQTGYFTIIDPLVTF